MALEKSLYLAGPDVFYPNAQEQLEEKSRLCRVYGFSLISPLDHEADTAEVIFDLNRRQIERADAVLANVVPFRGPHCDPGTAWEIGYAVARSKPVFAYSQDLRLLQERVDSLVAEKPSEGRNRIEPFGLGENLMVVMSLTDRTMYASFEQALEAVRKYYTPSEAARFLA